MAILASDFDIVVLLRFDCDLAAGFIGIDWRDVKLFDC